MLNDEYKTTKPFSVPRFAFLSCWRPTTSSLALDFPADETLDPGARLSIGHLLRRVFHGIGSNRRDRPARPTIPGQLTTTDHVDAHPGRVWRIFDGQTGLNLNGDIAKDTSFKP